MLSFKKPAMDQLIMADPEQVKAYADAEGKTVKEVVDTLLRASHKSPPRPRRLAIHEEVDGKWKHCIVDTETELAKEGEAG